MWYTIFESFGKKSEIVLFETEDKSVVLPVAAENETVWLSQAQMMVLFDTSKQNISLHIRNCFREGELEEDAVVKEYLTTALDGKKYKTKYYNLDVIISVGYRVKSQRGVEFRKWTNSVLKQYIVKGYAVNNNRMHQLGEVIRIMKRPKGNAATYVLTYEECKEVIGAMRFGDESDLFGKEKDDSFKGSIGNIYQSCAGQEIYGSLEEKAANLLYFVTKNHSFFDGNKRIAATMFLYFLDKNDALLYYRINEF